MCDALKRKCRWEPCGKEFDPDYPGRAVTGGRLRVYCSELCRRSAHAAQIVRHKTMRLVEGQERRASARCAICQKPIASLHGNARYCGPKCRGEGLIAAIERQWQRRQARRKASTPPGGRRSKTDSASPAAG